MSGLITLPHVSRSIFAFAELGIFIVRRKRDAIRLGVYKAVKLYWRKGIIRVMMMAGMCMW